jgi:hypothetical protein
MFSSYNMGTLCKRCLYRRTGCTYVDGKLVCADCKRELEATKENPVSQPIDKPLIGGEK